jgi:hypothetical protein
MRLAILVPALASALALTGVASAQMMGQMGGGMMGGGMSPMPPANGSANWGAENAAFPTAQQRYVARIRALKSKMDKLTQQDGGQLSDEHRASLQRELDGVNKSFGIKPAHG